MKHKKRNRFQDERQTVWCEAEVGPDDIVSHWDSCTCIECCKKAVFGTSKKGYWIDAISRMKAERQLLNLKGEK